MDASDVAKNAALMATSSATLGALGGKALSSVGKLGQNLSDTTSDLVHTQVIKQLFPGKSSITELTPGQADAVESKVTSILDNPGRSTLGSLGTMGIQAVGGAAVGAPIGAAVGAINGWDIGKSATYGAELGAGGVTGMKSWSHIYPTVMGAVRPVGSLVGKVLNDQLIPDAAFTGAITSPVITATGAAANVGDRLKKLLGNQQSQTPEQNDAEIAALYGQ
jgi:hypothetical protein